MDEKNNIWLKRAADAYTGSTTYFDANVRPQVESNIRQMQGRHPSGSKYYSDAYKSRARLFRPKTRGMVRKNEAICAAAFFANEDAISAAPVDDSNPLHRASAEVMQELVQYRLTRSIPWFLTVIGAYQDAMVTGVVASYQYWKYNEKKKIDAPCIELLPIENLRFDPGADWTDPVNSSPYVIRMIPMYAKDIKSRMSREDPKTGEPKWMKLTDGQIKSATKSSADTTRLAREGNRVDPKDQAAELSDYQICWVHQNFVDDDGEDYVYYTLGTEFLLSNPVRLDEMYAHNVRPIVMGCAIVESHKTYATAPVELVKEIQTEINEVANQRIDNVKFAMNKRYFVQRNRQVDIRSLTRNVPSSVTLMNDVDKDVKVIGTDDVTSSSYMEHDRLNLDFDDIAGAFSGSSVQANRKLNETVGGMTMLSEGANQISEYQLRTFVETWAQPVLRQLVLLEQQYETDQTILALAGKRAKLYEKYGISEITDELIEREMIVNVNVGLGSANPEAQFERFTAGIGKLIEILSSPLAGRLNFDEVTKEIFGKLGYKDGQRFFNQEEEQDPQVKSLTDEVARLQQELEAKWPADVKDATVKKLMAEAEHVAVKTIQTNVASQYSAMQLGQVVATTPGVAPIADQALEGAGFVPADGDGVNVPQGIPQDVQPDVNQNTSPMFPPVSPGPMDGIETPEADGVMEGFEA
jgi:hypothetical protein